MAEDKKHGGTSTGRSDERSSDDRDEGGRGSRARGNGIGGADAARRAKEQLKELTGREAVSVSALGKADAGWRLRVEMVEMERIPPTTNVMGSYEVELDQDGELVGYELVRRYHRGQVDEEAQ